MLRWKAVSCLNLSRFVWLHDTLCQGPAAGTCTCKWLIRLLARNLATKWPESSTFLTSTSGDSSAVIDRNLRRTAADPNHLQEPTGTHLDILKEKEAADGTSKHPDSEDASSAAVLVRDSSSLKPRLLKATSPPFTEKKASRRRRRHDGVAAHLANHTDPEHTTEAELQYFTADISAGAVDAGFAAAELLQRRAIDADTPQSPDTSAFPAAHMEASLKHPTGDSWAALLEMQQLQELRERHGGVLAPEDFEVVQVAKQRAARKLLPLEALASAVMNALQLGKKYGVDPKVLLTPRIADVTTDILQARAAQIRRMLPDAQLQEELLARGAEEVSAKITRIIATFRKQLGMDPPPKMLTQPGTFAKALRLPDEQLLSHLDALQHLVGSKVRARELANMYTNTVFSTALPGMLKRTDRVASALEITQDKAVEMVLRAPYIARTHQQLLHVEQMVQSAPSALRLPKQQLLSCFIKYPELFRYNSSNELAMKYHALAGIMPVSSKTLKQDIQENQLPQAYPAVLLDICSSNKVRQAVSMEAVAESLRTAAAIMRFKSPTELLPMLCKAQSKTTQGQVFGSGRRPLLVALLQPADKLAANAGFVQQQMGLSWAQVAQQARWYPIDIFCRDIKTRKLRHALLQGQLLGTEIMADDQLDPRMTAMLRKSPRVGNLQVDTALQRIHSLEAALQLQQGQAKQMVLRLPQLLVYQPAVLQELMQLLVRLLGDNIEAARDIVLQDPKVVVLLSQYRSGSLRPKLSFLSSLLSPAEPTAAHHNLRCIDDAASAAAAAVTAAAVRAASSGFITSNSHGMIGVRRKGSGGWECRSYLVFGNDKQYSSQHDSALKAACAQDLIRLALKGPTAAVNLSGEIYTLAEVEAMKAFLQEKRLEWQLQQQVPLEPASSKPHTEHHHQQRASHADMPEMSAAAQQQQQQEQAEEPMFEALFIRFLATKAGRQLLTCTSDTAHARLNALAAVLGLSVRDLLDKGLTSSSYLQGVLGLSPARIEAAAAELQQQLDLSLPQVQRVLRGMPALLLYKHDSLKAKTADLINAFASCCYAVQQTFADTSAAVGSVVGDQYDDTPSGSTHRCNVPSQQEQPPPMVLDAVSCLQRAILYAPQLLALKVERVTWRLQVLQDICCNSHKLQQQGDQQAGSLVQQLHDALHSGSLGRWLLTGDATYKALMELRRAYEEHGGRSSSGHRSNSMQLGTGGSTMPHIRLQDVFRRSSTSASVLLEGLMDHQ